MDFIKKDNSKTLIVPSNITSIEEDAYSNNNYIKKVILHDNIQTIGDSAFYMCTGLKNINLPESITFIDKNAFDYCTSLKSAIIPSKIKTIKSQTFSYCKKLDSVSLPNKLERIEDRAFEDCISLNSISIPNTVNYIGNQAFKGCTFLKSIEIPDNIEIIDEMLFYDCSSLKNIKLPEKLKKISYYSFCGCKNLKNINLPKTLNTIGEYAFNECKSMQEIEIPDAVKEIGKAAFRDARSLKYVKLPNNLSELSDLLFYDCKSLKTIVMPDKVKKLGSNSFYNCKSLKEISIPSSVSRIELGCFTKCKSLEKIDLSSNKLKKIEKTTFSECSNLKEVIFPSSISEIEEEAFYNCKRLKKVIIPERVINIGNSAFYKCPSIEEISLPKYIELDYCTFDNLKKCKRISLYNIDNLFESSINAYLKKSNRIYINYLTEEVLILKNSKEKVDESIYSKVDFKKIQNDLGCSKVSAILLCLLSKNKPFDYRKMGFIKSFINYLSEYKMVDEISKILRIDNTLEYTRLMKYVSENFELRENEYYDLFKFANNLGAFEDDGVTRQKACNFIENLLEKNKIKYYNIHDIFSEMEYGEYNDEWASFIMNKKNIDTLLKKDEETTGYMSRVYNEFFAIKEFYRRNKGNQSYRNVTVEACDKYFTKANFVGVTLDTIDIAPIISLYTKSQAAFVDAKNIRNEYLELKRKGEIKDHILNEELKETRTFEEIENIRKQIAKDSRLVVNELDKVANESFTYEYLSKYDPANFVLGKYCSCCAHLESVGYGIMHASIVVPSCQNLVIRNSYGRIIAKSTLYVNKEQGYGVFNTIEVNECIENNELKLIYEKFKKAAYDFAEKYNEENDVKLTQLNVGMSMNALAHFIRNNDTSGKILKAIDFSEYGKDGKKYIGDWYDEQYIIWKR